MFESGDPELDAASQEARETFKHFWRELSWEARRIVPGLSMAAIKVPFTDGDTEREGPSQEHMWGDDVAYDGIEIRGTLLNQPNWLRNVSEGDAVETTLAEITDWMYCCSAFAGNEVFGGYTVNLMRARMDPLERRAHDKAWGMTFGDPNVIQLVPQKKEEKRGFLARIFGPKESVAPAGPPVEHPMCVNMGPSLRENLEASTESISYIDEDGWSMLHREALAGNLTVIQLLLEYGADRDQKTPAGRTALDLAKILKWDHVIAALQD